MNMRHFFLLLFALVFAGSDSLAQGDQSGKDRVVGLWLMGQSLCEGAQSLPIVTGADTGRGNLAFKRGVRTWIYGKHADKPEDRPDEPFAFVPLTAAVYGGLGETIANGLADHLTAGEKSRFLVSYAGQGGRMIDELSEVDQSTDPRTPKSRQHGGGYYRTSLDDARRASKQANAIGVDFSIAALVWMQGEANGGPTGGINPSRWDTELPRPAGQEWYRDRLIAYREKWSRDLQAITGKSGELPLFTYQTLGPAGEAQLMAADKDPNITMVGPHYMVASGINSRYAKRYGAAIHLSADGERWYGEQVAKVIRRVLTEREKWQPLRPAKAQIADDRNSVLVDFQVPRPPLVLDQEFLSLQQYKMDDGYSSLCGFRVSDAAGGIALISSVEVESPTTIRIHFTSDLKTDKKYRISYGLPYSGQIGKITGIRSGPVVDDQATTELLIEGDLSGKLKHLIDEGTFHVTNMNTAGNYTQAPVRQVRVEDGSTVLRFENRELRQGGEFLVGQMLTALRPFSYGNLRDSDPEKAIYRFADKTYGRRAGESYPLWNWCVLFSGFSISEK